MPTPPQPVNQIVITKLSDGTTLVQGRLPKVRETLLGMLEEAKEHCLQTYYRGGKPDGPKIEVATADFLNGTGK